jgi:hypothetical protein
MARLLAAPGRAERQLIQISPVQRNEANHVLADRNFLACKPTISLAHYFIRAGGCSTRKGKERRDFDGNSGGPSRYLPRWASAYSLALKRLKNS